MKIRTKLGTVIACFIAIPIIILNFILVGNLKAYNQRTYESGISKTAKYQSESIADFFEEALNSSKEVVSSNYIKDFTTYSNLPEDQKSSSKEDQEYKQMIINQTSSYVSISNIKKQNVNVESAMIINNSGVVIASSDESTVGQKLPDAQKMFNVADVNNGVSAISVQSVNGKSIPVFYVAKSIFSNDNVKQGVFLQTYKTNFLQKIINSAKTYKSSNTLIVNSFGNIFEYPYENIKQYTDVSNYSNIKNVIKNSISADNQTHKSNFTVYSNIGHKSCAYNIAVPNANWSIISTAEISDIEESFNASIAKVKLASTLIILLVMALVIGFVFYFTKPIDNIVDILTKKQRGDQNARFEVKTNDEFGKIGTAFNLMFDDVFESEQRYRTIVEMTDNIVFEINFKKNNVFISNNFNQKFSFRAKSDNLQDSFFYKGRIHKDDKDRFTQDFERVLDDANYLQGEYRFKNIYGDFAWVMIRATKFFDRDETPTKIIGVIVDIDREKKSEMHLLQRASYDALTQLYNRETFIKSLSTEFELSSMRKTLDAVLFLDLDDFKHFNDEYGHACGDEVLKFTAESLKEIVFDKGFAGRFGGDEFVVCLNNQKYFGDPGKVAQDIIDALNKGFMSESIDRKLSINCSIGIAFFNENGSNCEEVLNAADEAMYGIKKHGKSNFGYALAKTVAEASTIQE